MPFARRIPGAASAGVFAALASLALLLAAAGTVQAARAQPGSPADPMVLVLNIISETHARPATGVVVAQAAPGASVLVLVPAAFVSAGDEIIVLDGGTDILRNGRATRTVARSAEAGLALLEVEGLDREGAALDGAYSLPTEAHSGGQTLQFAAWPAANALAEGAPLHRLETRPQRDAAGRTRARPALPGVSGPLFNPCGGLAAWHLAGEESQIIDAQDIAAFAQGAGLALQAAACGEVTPPTTAAETEEQAETVLDPGAQGEAPAQTGPESRASGRPGAKTPASRENTYPAAAVLLAVLLALILALGWIVLRRRRSSRDQVILTGHDHGGQAVRVTAPIDRTGSAVIAHDGASVRFLAGHGRIRLCNAGEDGESGGVAVAGTPLLPGERAYLPDGAELSLGASRLVAHIEYHAGRRKEGQ